MNNAELVQSLFQSALGRPVEAGNTFFNTALANDTSRADVAATIMVSREAQQFAQSFYQTGIRVA